MEKLFVFCKFVLELRDEIIKDHSFIGVLSVFPSLGVENFLQSIISNELPASTADLIHNVLSSARKETSNRTVISVGFIGALWAATSGMVAIIKQLNIAYNVQNTPSFINIRIKGLKLTFVFSMLEIFISLSIIGLKYIFSEFIDPHSFTIHFYIIKKKSDLICFSFFIGPALLFSTKMKEEIKIYYYW